jgi:tetratricopeptide (TPR) repeat protein
MRISSIVLCFGLCGGLAAADLEKTQKKELEVQVKAMTAEAAALERSGQLAEARVKYAESQALIEMKEVTDAIKHLDEGIHNRIKTALSSSSKLYEARKFQQAAAMLEDSMKLQAFQRVISYDLALCYYQLGDRKQAFEYLERSKAATADPKQRQKLLQLLSFITTGENAAAKESDKDRIGKINQLAEGIGLDASLEDDFGFEDSPADSDTPGESGLSTAASAPSALKTNRPAGLRSEAGHRSSLCNALGEMKANLATSPAATFDLANCAETNGRTAEAVRLLEAYLEMAPTALDAAESRARIADLKLLLTVPGQNGVELRRLDASAYGALAERKYDVALAAFNSASELAPNFAPTRWKLALLQEAFGNVDLARENFKAYQKLTSDPAAKDEAELHLASLEARRTKYDEEVGDAEDILADLLNRSMKLTFNGSEKRSAIRTKRAQVKKKADQSKARTRVGGFAIPFAYAQQQLSRASEHLQVALALFPLGAEANELMGLVFLQANDGHAATRSFDVVASQGLPVSFYAEMRTRKQDAPVKVELSRDTVRLIFLSSYDKKGNAAPPKKPAGDDGLGDMVIEPAATRDQEFDSVNVSQSDIRKVETDKGVIKLKYAQQEVWLSPIYLPSFTPIEGPQARRFANNYTRMFARYPGLENSKLGSEGMTGGEKFKMGYNIAMAGMDIATGGFTLIGAISSVQDAISIARTIRAAMASLNVSFASWERTVGDRQQLLAGKAFKSIPIQAANLGFLQDAK